jgi:hypothetical protein
MVKSKEGGPPGLCYPAYRRSRNQPRYRGTSCGRPDDLSVGLQRSGSRGRETAKPVQEPCRSQA